MKIFSFFVDQSKRLMALGVIVLILLTSAFGVVSGDEPEENKELLNCLCRCLEPPGGQFSCSYDTEDRGWSPSCRNLSNGPCICKAYGCFRWPLPTEGECYDNCYAKYAQEKPEAEEGEEKPPRFIDHPEKLEEFLCSQGYHNSTCPPKGDPPPGSVKFWSLVPGGGISHSSVMLSYGRQIEMGHKRKPRGNKSEYISEILPPWENPKPRKGNYSLQKTLCPPPTYHVNNDCIENMKGIDREYKSKRTKWNCHGFSAHVVHNCVETGIRMKPTTDFKWKGETLILNKGEVWGDVIPLTIQIPQGAVQFGSEYTIEVRNDNTTIIYLIKGKADYKGIGHSLSLSSGQMGVIDPTGTPLPPTTFNISEMDLWWTELNYEGKGSSAPIPKPLEIVKLFTAKSVYPRGEKVDVHYHIKNTGTVDVDEYHVEYDIIDAIGKTVYRNVGGAHSISAGDENKWHSEKWEIPSNAEYGPCTIEARLKWDSETDMETTDFLVTQATRAKDKTAELEITELYTSKFEYSRGEAIKLCYRIKNVGTTNAEYHLCNIIEVEGEKGYWFIFSTHSIAAGEEQKRCAAGCWKIPSDTKCGTYTIETILVWDSKTVKKETTFIVK